MGVCVQEIKNIIPRSRSEFLVGFIWIVGRREERKNLPPAWYIQGIAEDESTAIRFCRDETYWIGPLPLGVMLQHDKQEWIGSYFPLLQKDKIT